jgi:AraC family transcriptional activator FtrA
MSFIPPSCGDPGWSTSGIIVIMGAKAAIVAGRPRTVAVAVYDGLSMFEFAVALEVFGPRGQVDPDIPWYRLQVCAAEPGPVTVDNGLRIEASAGLDQLGRADTVLVPPCDDPGGVPPEMLHALRAAHGRGARLVSLCTGAFVLAAAGLLDGRRATTHWAECADLARRYPGTTVDPDVLYVDGGDILTSAGSAASIDLCLHLVRQDHGADVAARLARDMVVQPYREGGQAQFITTPLPEVDDSDLFADTIAWALRHLDLLVTVDDLASRSAMSERTFARRFRSAMGTSPYRWLLRQRIQRAQGLLETTDLPVDTVAAKCGMVNGANLRKHFGRVVRTTPQAYRRAFRSRRGDGAPAAS